AHILEQPAHLRDAALSAVPPELVHERAQPGEPLACLHPWVYAERHLPYWVRQGHAPVPGGVQAASSGVLAAPGAAYERDGSHRSHLPLLVGGAVTPPAGHPAH